MKPKTAKREFERFIKESGKKRGTLTPAEGIQLMLDFYWQVRAENCPLDENGDMLLYQWGTYDWGDGRFFQCDITRQFILAGTEGDDGMSQLSFTFYFHPSAEFDALKAGNRWCASPAALAAFQSFVTGTDAYRVVASSTPVKLSLEYGGV